MVKNIIIIIIYINAILGVMIIGVIKSNLRSLCVSILLMVLTILNN